MTEIINMGAHGLTARTDAYSHLGTNVTGLADPMEVLQKAKLTDWNVHLEPALTTLLQDDGVETIQVPGKFAVVRTNPDTGRLQPMGGVRSASYHPVQNEETARLLGAITDQSGAHANAAGQLNGGNRVFVSMKLPDTMLVGGVDPVDRYIVAFNSHDGSSALRVCLTHVRLFCANQQAAVLAGAQSSYAIYHTKSAKAQIEEVRLALGLSFAYDTEFEAVAAQMIADQLEVDEFRNIVAHLVGAEEGAGADKGAQKGRWERVDKMTTLFEYGPTGENIRGTAWCGYQAITEYLDHYAPVAGDRDAAKVRATRVASGQLDPMKQRAFALLSN